MRQLLVFTFCFFIWSVPPAIADEFSDRVERAQQLENPDYESLVIKDIGLQMAKVMRACFGFGPQNKGKNFDGFQVISDVAVDGRLSNIDVYPEYPESLCFKNSFALFTLPEPPLIEGENSYPFLLKMSITE